MKYHILVYWNHTICNLPTHDKTPYPSLGVLVPAGLEKKKESLTEIVNALFNGEHNRIFGVKEDTHILHGHPDMIVLSVEYPPKFPPSYENFPSAYHAYCPKSKKPPN